MNTATINASPATSSAYLYQPGESELRWMGDTSTQFLATGGQTGSFCLVDERAARGDSVPLHRHEADMESFYVLEGEIAFFLGDQPGIRAKAGAFAHMPAGTVHGFRIESETARYLILTTPRHHPALAARSHEAAGAGWRRQDQAGLRGLWDRVHRAAA